VADSAGSAALTRAVAQVRPIAPADSDAWLAMRCALWPDDDARWHADQVAQFLAGRLSMPIHVLVAVDSESRVVGFAELSIRAYAEGCVTDRIAYLEGWFVEPDARRMGVGRALIEAAEAWGRSQNCTEFGSDALLDNVVSAEAHRALGFEEVVQIRCFRKSLA
jgi:aminoglycoside 6'-N-acetyltransferase I